MNRAERKHELLELMKQNKMFQLPPTCQCGFRAKKTWMDMEAHYEVCEQYRRQLKSIRPKKESDENN